MLASQAAHREDEIDVGDEDTVLTNNDIPEARKRAILQRLLHMAASNGDLERVRKLIHGASKSYVDVNAPDEEGAAPIIYASCFVSIWNCAMSGMEVWNPDEKTRDIKKLYWYCWRLVQKSIGRTRMNGLL